MAFSFDAAYGVHAGLLSQRSAKIAVESSNILNSETPSYRALQYKIYMDTAGMPMLKTSPMHIDAKSAVQNRTVKRGTGRISEDGNDVSLAFEQGEMGKNVEQFNTTLGFLNYRMQMLQAIIKGGS